MQRFCPESSKLWKFPATKFQTLELFLPKFPNLGTFLSRSSKPWKFFSQNFQTLELFLSKFPNLGTFACRRVYPAPAGCPVIFLLCVLFSLCPLCSPWLTYPSSASHWPDDQPGCIPGKCVAIHSTFSSCPFPAVLTTATSPPPPFCKGSYTAIAVLTTAATARRHRDEIRRRRKHSVVSAVYAVNTVFLPAVPGRGAGDRYPESGLEETGQEG